MNTENTIIPKFNVPSQMNYSSVMNLNDIDASDINREVITDTYVTADENEDKMFEQLDNALTSLKGKTHGFAGYLSFCYAQLTMFYLLHKKDMCKTVIEKINKCIDSIEKFAFTKNYQDENGNDTSFVNYAFGEDDFELKHNSKFIVDAWNTAKLIHAKASSFESSFSLIVTQILAHGFMKQYGMLNNDCNQLRIVIDKISNFMDNESDTDNIEAPSDMNFGSIENIEKEA